MKLIDYIQGTKDGKDANELEQKAMTDAFLSDAMDGYDSASDNALEDIRKMTSEILRNKNTYKKNHKSLYLILGIATVIVILAVIFLSNDSRHVQPMAAGSIPTEQMTNSLSTDSTIEATTLQKVTKTISDTTKIITTNVLQKNLVTDSVKDTDTNVAPQLSNNSQDTVHKTTTFDKYEFVAYFKSHYNNALCSDQRTITVTVSFHLNSVGHPQNISVLDTDCPEIKNQVITWLMRSPNWSRKNTDIKLKFTINTP